MTYVITCHYFRERIVMKSLNHHDENFLLLTCISTRVKITQNVPQIPNTLITIIRSRTLFLNSHRQKYCGFANSE